MTDEATPTDPSAGADADAPVDSPVNSCPAECPRCRAKVTTEQLKEIFPSATDDKISDMASAFNDAYLKFDINTCLRKAHFFAQVKQEVGDAIESKAENLNYSPQGLKNNFRYFRKHPDEADLYGRVKGAHAADQEAIANRAYANRNGNGDIASGDGWKYRGKGYIQLTGKGNYQDVQNEIDTRDPGSGIDIIANEDDILTTKGAMLSAMGFWTLNELNLKADQGDKDSHVDAITAVVNKNTDSYEERQENFKQTKKTFKVDECQARPFTLPLQLGGEDSADSPQLPSQVPIPRARPANL